MTTKPSNKKTSTIELIIESQWISSDLGKKPLARKSLPRSANLMLFFGQSKVDLIKKREGRKLERKKAAYLVFSHVAL